MNHADGTVRRSQFRSAQFGWESPLLGPPGRSASQGLELVGGDLAGARIGLRLESHLLTLAQGANSGALERGGMDEYILAAVVRLNKAEALLIVVELHRTRSHESSFHWRLCTWDQARDRACFPVLEFGESSETCAAQCEAER